MTTTLAIDPGTRCGFALCVDGTVTSGVWDLNKGGHETRWLNLWERLESVDRPGLLVWEMVMSHRRPGQQSDNTMAAHVYGGIVAVLEMWAEWRGVRTRAIAVPTIRKAVTGSGKAKKAEAVAAIQRLWPDAQNDNQADALAVLVTALPDAVTPREECRF